jgi:hypothetical protein
MLRIIALLAVYLVSWSAWAEGEQAAGKEGEVHLKEIELDILPQDEYIKQYRAEFDKSVSEGKINKMREMYQGLCLQMGGPESYCACASKLYKEQTDEFLFYDGWTQFWLDSEMKDATEAGKAYRYKRLLLQSTQRDSIKRRVIDACGYFDEATKKFTPVKKKD